MDNTKTPGDKNVEKFREWVASQKDDDFKQIIYRGKLHRGAIAKSADFGESALKQNKTMRRELAELEARLTERGVLSELTDTAKEEAGESTLFDGEANKRILESRNASKLELENIELKAEIKKLEEDKKELKAKLERFKEHSEVAAEMGLFPR